jgi:CelD/BcsL family acetyltransferase involved in cellulose biosynthesis
MAHLLENAPHGANRRQVASKNDKARQKKTAHDERRQEVSGGATVMSLRTPRKKSRSRATFLGQNR